VKICYQEKTFQRKSLVMIKLCNEIIDDFRSQGFDLTLRQLYYQLVSRDVIPNNERSYDNVGALLNDARLAGLVDWNAIIDRTRYLRALPHWNAPNEIIEGAAAQFNYDRWADQPQRVEVWIEKDALVGVIGSTCSHYDVPFFSCRGYTSQSEMWDAAQRVINYYDQQGQNVVILHLGDHDPSGLDMSRDIDDRLTKFCEHHGTPAPLINRLALNKPQIRQYNPPPNPAKMADCRYSGYVREHGEHSWELDALNPGVISKIVEDAILVNLDEEKFKAATARQAEARAELSILAKHYGPALTGARKVTRKQSAACVSEVTARTKWTARDQNEVIMICEAALVDRRWGS
jgi:hypothetical protein